MGRQQKLLSLKSSLTSWTKYSQEGIGTMEKELKVIGAGLSRTGTLSTRAALEELLGGSCYHGVVPVVEKVNCTQSQASNVQFFPERASSLVESGHLQQQANRDR